MIWGVWEGEPGVAGVTVELTSPGADGDWNTTEDNTFAALVTDASGHYTFTALYTGKPNGDPMPYSIFFEPPSGLRFVDANVGSDDAVDSDGEDEQPVAQHQWVAGASVMLSPGQPAQRHVDAGLYRNEVAGRVWLDEDGDGIQDPTETGIENLAVALIRGTIVGGAPERVVQTDSTGRYTITHARPEDNLLLIGPINHEPSPMNQGGDDSLDSEGRASDCWPSPGCFLFIPVRPGSNRVTPSQDFGLIPQGRITVLAETVHVQNGLTEIQPRSGVSLTLYLMPPQPPPQQIANKSSDSAGVAQFQWLKSGLYQLLGERPGTLLLYNQAGFSQVGPALLQSRPQLLNLASYDKTDVVKELSLQFYQPDASGPATPSDGGSVSAGGVQRSSVQTRTVSLDVPPAAVTQTVTLHLTDLAASAVITGAGWPRGYAPTDYGFLWDITVGDVQQSSFDLLQPATVTLHAGAQPFTPDENILLRWDAVAAAWVASDSACGAAPGWQAGTSPATLVAPICRSGRYGVFAPAAEIFLPIVAK
jgi:hypothetical protein